MKVWQIMGMVEADGWQLVGREEATGSTSIRRSEAGDHPGKRSDDLHPIATSILRQAGLR